MSLAPDSRAPAQYRDVERPREGRHHSNVRRHTHGRVKSRYMIVGWRSQPRQSGLGWRKRSHLLEKGEAMFAALGVAANRRLFREESNEQRSRPNDLQQTMGWSRS
jgi:hypothetical protein